MTTPISKKSSSSFPEHQNPSSDQDQRISQAMKNQKRTFSSVKKPESLSKRCKQIYTSSTDFIEYLKKQDSITRDEWIEILLYAETLGIGELQSVIHISFALENENKKAAEIYQEIFHLCPRSHLNLFITLQSQEQNWINSNITTNLLLSLISIYNSNFNDFIEVLFDLDDGLTSNQINAIIQKMAAQNNPDATRLNFYQNLLNQLCSLRFSPTPFSWSQAILKCVQQQDLRAKLLWDIAPSNLPNHWKKFMEEQYFVQKNPTFISLLPFFYQYTSEDQIGMSDPEVQYVDYDLNTLWTNAIRDILQQENDSILNWLVQPLFIEQLDFQTIFDGYTSLLDQKKFSIAKTLIQSVKHMKVDLVNELIIKIQTLLPDCSCKERELLVENLNIFYTLRSHDLSSVPL